MNDVYVIYDQFHWLNKDHFVMIVNGYDYALGVYQFQKFAYPDKCLGFVTLDYFNKLKVSIYGNKDL